MNGNTVKGRPGGTYTLQIKLPDGRTYQSTPEKMPVVSKPADSPFYRVVTDTRITNGIEINSFMVNIYLNTSLAENNKTGLYRWAVSEVWNIFPTCLPGAISCPPICYIYEPYSRFNLKVVKAADYSEFAIRELLLLSRGIDFSFNGRHYFNVTQYSMNQQAYEYWNKVEQLITKRGSIFDAPPAIIPGNISNVSNPDELVLGYFEASATQLTRTFVDRGAIHTYVETCFYYDPYFSFTNISQFCFDCTRHVGSTIVQPGWYW